MVPYDWLPPTVPLTLHVIVAPGARQKDAANDSVSPSPTLEEEGEIEFVAGHVIITLAEPVLEPSARLVAVIVTFAGCGGTDGAV